MIKRVLIIGGYGNFGWFIAKSLAQEKNIRVIIAGRSLEKAKRLAATIDAVNDVEVCYTDINQKFSEALSSIAPHIVIHTSGPFQSQGYDVANICIDQGIHYIDLADGRDFVAGIGELDGQAKKNDVLVVSGASSVPCLTAALVDYYKGEFSILEVLDYGITTAQKTARGLATTEAILGYVGKPIKTLIEGEWCHVFGWQGLRARKYRMLGRRFLAYCDVPDLALFPKRYPGLKTIRFYAGLEISFIHLTLWMLSGVVRIGGIRNLEKVAPLMLRISHLFDFLGTDTSAFHMTLSGKGRAGAAKSITFELTARSGDGPYIPTMPAILMAKKLANDDVKVRGAFPCVGFITRDEYLGALEGLDISWYST
ncbi:saccharopine dehydrogenase NADP-binding domain-containing protein [Paremcibacter congregatus]|uniref:saccharopine dehydrogenase family protein n=1 Tax=Paremcibacter congregatus TaxID=2043170 RepID=UPI003A9552CA